MKISIASGKGGTGKTTLSINLAQMLSQQMDGSKDVVLIDLDVEEPNSGVFINGSVVHREPKYRQIPEVNFDKCTFCGRCKEVCNFNAIATLPENVLVFPELCHSCNACVGLCPENAMIMKDHAMGELVEIAQDDLKFVESTLNIGEQQAVPLISQAIEYSERTYNDGSVFIYDSPPGTSCPMIESVKGADFVILVSEPTPFGLHDLKLSVETMQKLGKSFGVVINRDGLGKDLIGEYCSEHQVPLLGRIPDSREIATLYSRGDSVFHLESVYTALKNIIGNIETQTNKNIF
ncbi:MAG: ATP-binding protein [Bacteroidota bacterium]